MRRVLIVDSNSYLYCAAYAFGTYDDGVIVGMTKYITDLLDVGGYTDVVMCWDKGKSRWRREVYPEYKAGRAEKAQFLDMDAVYRQGEIVESRFEVLGVRQIHVYGVEADDLVSWVSDYYKADLGYDKVVIATSDKDLFQLLDLKTVIFDHLKGKSVDEDFIEETFGLRYDQIVDLKSLAGDSSDNIKGVAGVGDKRATDLICKYGGLGEILDLANTKELSKLKSTKKVLDQSDSAELAYRLVKIPSLKEAKWYLNEKELKSILFRISQASKKVVQSSFKAQLMTDRLTSNVPLHEKGYSLVEEDLTGMEVYFREEKDEKPLSLASIDSAILRCRRCTYASYGCQPILPEGYSDAEIMVVGRNPTKEDFAEGKLFTEEVGERLDEFLEAVGLTRRDCWMTNVNKCHFEYDRPTTIGEIRACSSYLKAEIELLQPKFIIALGSEAMALLTPYGYSGVTKHCGEILEKPQGVLGGIDAWVAVCVHPSMALRSKSGEVNMEYAAEQVKEFLNERK